jgi:hypothetical protein
MGFKRITDHIDENGCNNQKHNLQDLTNKQNAEKARLSKRNTSGCKGVTWHKLYSKWQAYICHNGKDEFLGYFDKLEDAIAARKADEERYFTHGVGQSAGKA